MSTALFEPTRKSLEGTFNTGWGARTPIRWNNMPFNQPSNSAWVGFKVVWGTALQVSIGPVDHRLVRGAGVILVSIFTPKNSSTKAGSEHADYATQLLQMKQWSDTTAGIVIDTQAGQLSDNGSDKEFQQMNLSIPFQVDGNF